MTTVSNNSKQGDGLTATCFLLGVEKATQLVESMDDIQAIFIIKDGQIITTKGIGVQMKFVPAASSAAPRQVQALREESGTASSL